MHSFCCVESKFILARVLQRIRDSNYGAFVDIKSISRCKIWDCAKFSFCQTRSLKHWLAFDAISGEMIYFGNFTVSAHDAGGLCLFFLFSVFLTLILSNSISFWLFFFRSVSVFCRFVSQSNFPSIHFWSV